MIDNCYILIYFNSKELIFMHIEYECTILEIDKEKFIEKIEKLGAKKIGDFYQKRYVYDFNPVDPNKWIRLRNNGKKTTLTIKNIVDKNKIGGTEELEIEVSNFENTNKILETLGYKSRNYQENKRVTYELDDVEIDIDSWPMIPTYVELEGKDEQSVINLIKKLEIEDKNITNYDVVSIYKEIYGIDILGIKDLRF